MSTDTEHMSDAVSTATRPPLAMRLLRAGVPLTLLLDLTSPKGPDSVDICISERPRR